ncbi:MAG: DNA polymerase III subunit epsilon [Gammaproteobacteria bacterium]|nr:DNA polymerase III subunit epsilon [Gammaproteobacteria bacterium]
MRQIVLDTETTGLDATEGHRIIEIGGVEVIGRRLTKNHFHQYVNPEREIDVGAQEVHGISSAFLQDKPKFADIAEAFIEFVTGAELVIHNAAFDVEFINAELARLKGFKRIESYCSIVDSLAMARERHPGQRNSLDALCGRYFVDNSQRDLHGALLDAEILADVYLAMTGGQTALSLEPVENANADVHLSLRWAAGERPPLRVVRASDSEMSAHEARLDVIDKSSESGSVWRQLHPNTPH